MPRRRLTLAAAWGFLLAGPILFGPATQAALGHSELVTSAPAAGQVVATAPTEIQLVFSEPVEPDYSSLDLIGPDGATVAASIGSPDPSDPRRLVAAIPPLPDGVYTVNWQAVSAADGHRTTGFFTFGVGDVTPPTTSGSSTEGGTIHAGHDAASAFLETESRIVGNLGLLLAFGLPIVAWLVLRDPRSTGLAKIVAAALAMAAVGAAGLLALGSQGTGSDIVAYATESRTGQILVARAGLVGAAAVMAWIVARTRPRLSLAAGLVAGLGGIGLLAFGSHAAAFETPAPIVAIVVHLIAVGTWLAGLLSVAWLAIAGGPAAWSPARIVPRFSALALVSVGLIGLTGVYADWVHTRSLVPLDSQYGSTLVIKSILALGAFVLGGLNFLSGGRADDRRLRPRLALEAGLAISVLIVTGLVASGSPPAGELPIAIAPARSSVAAAGPAPTLALAPGRPGPTRFVVTFDAAIDDGVELQLQRLDQSGESRLQLAPIPDQPGQFQAGGGLLPADSRWDASVVRRDSSGSEIARTRFSFALDDTGISEGAASPAVDPAVVVAVIALVLAALGLAFALGGGVLPRVDPATSRIGVAGASIAAAVLGVAILLGGPTT